MLKINHPICHSYYTGGSRVSLHTPSGFFEVGKAKTKFWFDNTFNYLKEVSKLAGTLWWYLPHCIDIYYDNVGGEMLDAALLNMQRGGRVWSMISHDNLYEPKGVRNLQFVILNRVQLEGFSVLYHFGMYAKFD
uniref:Alcohol dehydrogenase-like C-terminal domain-containing protein n=1 Tax=Leersia perrieri TaxID=77586 RepID=A0A0D9XQX7_9ORYZ